MLRSTHTIEKVLILGSSGRVGRLLYAAWQHSSKLTPLWHIRSGEVQAHGVAFDILQEPEKMQKAMRGADVVLNLAGVTPASAHSLRLNSELAHSVLHAAASAGGIPIVHMSSAAVYRSVSQGEIARGAAPFPHRESDVARPITPYGIAKLEAENMLLAQVQELQTPVTILRLGNLLGADQLVAGNAARSAVQLDQFPDGRSPQRSYIGPRDLFLVLEALLTRAHALPDILNLALPKSVEMAGLLRAANRDFSWRPASEAALPCAELDVSRLAALVDLPNRSAADIVRDFRETGEARA